MKNVYKIGLLILSVIFVMSACKDDEMDKDFEIKPNLELDIPEDDSTQVTIESGNGDYVIAHTQEGIVSTRMEENTIWIKALKPGRTFLWITDSKGKSFYIRATVVSRETAQTTSSPSFVYDDASYALETANGWALTASDGRIAVTNADQKTQYLLAWNGDLKAGDKTDGVMRIIKDGAPVASYALTKMNVKERDTYNVISFSANDKDGRVIFSKL